MKWPQDGGSESLSLINLSICFVSALRSYYNMDTNKTSNLFRYQRENSLGRTSQIMEVPCQIPQRNVSKKLAQGPTN